MRFLSVCSGIEAASVAWNPLGWHAAAFSEIEPFPCSVLAHHYPTVPNRGDMTKFEEWPLEPIDLLCGGTPCQSFSVAGLRKGLADPRGNLMLTFGAIAARYRPRWLVWENVPGVLSSNGGRDFGSFLGMLGQLGYGFAYRVLDAQYFGVAQRRRRVFVVGCLGDWRSAAAVLFERHSLSGHPAPSRQAGQGVAATLDARTEGGGFPGTDGACGGHVVPTLTAQYGEQCGQDYMNGLAVPVLAAGAHGSNGAGIGRHGDPMFALDTTGAQAIAFGWQNSSAQGDSASEHFTPTLDKSKTPAVAHPYTLAIRGRGDSHDLEFRQDGTANALLTPNGGRAGIGVGAFAHAMQVRRLTPREGERLQGFPDDYTAIPHRGKPAADGPRYKALGNSWAVPNVRWIGRRIDQVQALLDQREEIAA